MLCTLRNKSEYFSNLNISSYLNGVTLFKIKIMCLISNSDRPYVADRDLTCYKVYILINNRHKSPYQRADMPKIGELTTTSLQKPGSFIIEKGFHSFVSFIDAVNEVRLITTIYSYETYIFKCVIPKGTKYYEGSFNCIPSYCSESIIIEEPADTSFLEL